MTGIAPWPAPRSRARSSRINGSRPASATRSGCSRRPPQLAPGLVTIHDNAPTNDRWNYAAVEVLPASPARRPRPPHAERSDPDRHVPASPANQNSPKILGSAEAGTTVRLYTSADCSGSALATVAASALPTRGSKSRFPTTRRPRSAPPHTGTEGTSSARRRSPTSRTRPPPQTRSATHPPRSAKAPAPHSNSPAKTRPARPRLLRMPARLDRRQAPGQAAHRRSPTHPRQRAPTCFEVRARRPCREHRLLAGLFEWQINVPPPMPSAPSLTGTLPASPANQNSPKILGSAEAGSTVRLYTSADCWEWRSRPLLPPLCRPRRSLGCRRLDDLVPRHRNNRRRNLIVLGTDHLRRGLDRRRRPRSATHPPALSESAWPPSNSPVKTRRLRPRLVRMPARLDRRRGLDKLRIAEALHNPRQRAPTASRSARDRPGREHRRLAGDCSNGSQRAAPPPTTGPRQNRHNAPGHGGSTISAPALTTSKPGELLLAFIGSDGPKTGGQTISGVSGGGLTWTLRKRANRRRGRPRSGRRSPRRRSPMRWSPPPGKNRLSGRDQRRRVHRRGHRSERRGRLRGRASGAPSASLITTRAGGWVWAVGEDWDNAIGRTVGSGQTLRGSVPRLERGHLLGPAQDGTHSVAGTTVAINDTAPTTDRWNLALVEVLPAQ